MLKAPRKAKPAKRRRPRTTNEKGLGADWRRCVASIRAERGEMCERCWELFGRVTPCQAGHHVVPRSIDMSKRLDPSNVMLVCHECHEAIHTGGVAFF